MTKYFIKNKALQLSLLITSAMLMAPVAQAQIDMAQQPVLVITNKAMTPSNSSPIYSSPAPAPIITQDQVANEVFAASGTSMIGGKIQSMEQDVFALQSTITRLSEQLNNIQSNDRNVAAGYYANVATINTALQTGTTPGNPRLVKNLDQAQANLDTLSNNVANLNALALEAADAASRASYLLNTIRSTYNLTGAVEEDHVRLAQMEDNVNSTVVGIDRILNKVNDDISRTTSYLATERNNMRTLSLAVTNGDLYGRSLSNYPFSSAPQSNLMQPAAYSSQNNGYSAQPASMGSAPTRPLAKIRFDKPNVDYQQPVYNVIQDAMQQYPNARFELVAVHPTAGNAAEVAIESTRARRNAEEVLRTLTQMGIPLDKIDLSNSASAEARTSEVHLYLR